MEQIQYLNAFTEVLEILKYISKKDYEKIPLEFIEIMEDNCNPNYSFTYNLNLSLSDQNISKEAKTIIAILFRDYWATNKQKEIILEKEKYDNYLENKEKELKYSYEIFKNNNIDKPLNKEKIPKLEIIKKETFFHKFISSIKRIFNHK